MAPTSSFKWWNENPDLPRSWHLSSISECPLGYSSIHGKMTRCNAKAICRKVRMQKAILHDTSSLSTTKYRKHQHSCNLFKRINCTTLLVACGYFNLLDIQMKNQLVEGSFLASSPSFWYRSLRKVPQVISSNDRRNDFQRHNFLVNPSSHITYSECTMNGVSLPSVLNISRSNAMNYIPSSISTEKKAQGHKLESQNQRYSLTNCSNKPWNANRSTSLRTQMKIQSAASTSAYTRYSNPVTIAHSILCTLLGTPSTECNAANIVCALTLSAKTLGGKKTGESKEMLTEDFSKSLRETLDILQLLLDERKLTPRQLCNSAWAIAKHVDFDESLYSRAADRLVLVKENCNNYSTWDLNKAQLNGDDIDSCIDKVLNSIAICMIEHLEMIHGSYTDQNKGKIVKSGELCMLMWAFAVAKPRDRPPGWERPRQVEQLSSAINQSNESQKKIMKCDDGSDEGFATFVDDVSGFHSALNFSDEAKSSQCTSVTSRLFNAVAIAFCQQEGGIKNEYTLLQDCAWNELSNIAWSFATRGACGTIESEEMMVLLAKECTRRIRLSIQSQQISSNRSHDILPRDVVQIAWALGTMESDNVSVGDAFVFLVDAICEYWNVEVDANQNSRRLQKWKCADLVQLATALAHGRLDNRSLLAAIYRESLDRLRKFSEKDRSRFSTSEISILLWVQARLYLTQKYGDEFGEFPRLACHAVLQQIQKTSTHYSELKNDASNKLYSIASMREIGLHSQEQANLAWSLTVLNEYDQNVILLLQNIFHAASSMKEGIIQLEHAHQLWQSFFILSKECPSAVEFVPKEFSQYLQQKWNIEKRRNKQSSSRHKAISRLLDLMRVAHRNEYDEDVDVAIVLEEESGWTHTAKGNFKENGACLKVAVEFDGPHHFTVLASTGKDISLVKSGAKVTPRVLGHTVLKYRLLKMKGWTVVRIPYYEFDKIPYWASMERQRYLQRALKTHDKIQFSDADVSEYQAMPQIRHSRFD